MSIQARIPIPSRPDPDTVPNRYRTEGFRDRYRYPYLWIFGFGIIGIGTGSVWHRYFNAKYRYRTDTEPIPYRTVCVRYRYWFFGLFGIGIIGIGIDSVRIPTRAHS